MLRRKSLVDFDCLFAPKQKLIRKPEPIDVIDSMLMGERVKKKPERFGSYIMGGKPSSTCPWCNSYVENEGVLCVLCNAYVHFRCVGVSQEEVDREWNGIGFECHHHNAVVSKTAVTKIIEAPQSQLDVECIFTDLKINSYRLNVKGKVKDKLTNLCSTLSIVENDGGRQYTVRLNSVTYQLIMENFIMLGNELGGVHVKRDDVDQCGINVQAQYIVKIGTDVDVSVTCYHTTSRMLIQILGKKMKRNQKYNEKLTKLNHFVMVAFVNLVTNIENAPKYSQTCAVMKLNLEDKLAGLSATKEVITESDNTSVVQITKPKAEDGLLINNVAPGESVVMGTDSDTMEIVTEGCKNEVEIISDYHNVEIISSNSYEPEVDQVNGDKRGENVVLGNEGEGVVHMDVSKPIVIQNQTNGDKHSDKVMAVISESVVQKEESKAVVIHKPGNEISKKKLANSFDVLRRNGKNEDVRINGLFNIILKLKEKGNELKNNHIMSYQHNANERINKLTLQLVSKQNEMDKLKKKQKETENQVNELKKLKKEWDLEKKSKVVKDNVLDLELIETLKNDIVNKDVQIKDWENKNMDAEVVASLKDNQITGYKKINEDLRAQIVVLGKKITGLVENEEQLSKNLKMMEDVASYITSGQKDNADKSAELNAVKKKLDDSNKNNSLLKETS
jgi:hypothetical protein